MSATIKRYQPVGHDFDVEEDAYGNYVLHADHLASHAYDEEKERALFEAAMRNIHKGDLRHLESWHVDGYCVHHIQEMWELWKACAKARTKAAGCE